MALQLSTGAKIAILNNGFVPTFDDGILLLFTGTPVANPDNAISGAGNLLVALGGADPAAWMPGVVSGHGIDWEPADAAGVVKPSAANLNNINLLGIADGTARWFWLVPNVANALDVTASATIPRVQGTVAVGGGDLRLSNSLFEDGSLSNADKLEIDFA